MKVANNVVAINKLLILYWITLCLCKCIGSNAAGPEVSPDKVAATVDLVEEVSHEVLSNADDKSKLDKLKKFIVSVFEDEDFDLFNIKLRDPSKYADDSLLTRVGNGNKVSFTLRGIHKIIEHVIFENAKKKLNPEELDDGSRFKDLTDDEVIKSACAAHDTKMCQWAVETALKMKPEGQKAAIATALKELPITGKPWQLLYLRLFDSGINILEVTHLDRLADIGIDSVARLNPVTQAVAEVADALAEAKIKHDKKKEKEREEKEEKEREEREERERELIERESEARESQDRESQVGEREDREREEEEEREKEISGTSPF